MAYYFLLSPQLLAQQQLLPANQQQLLAQQIIQSSQLQGDDLIQHSRHDAIDLTEEEDNERKFKIEPRNEVYYEDNHQHVTSWETAQQTHHQPQHQTITAGGATYHTIEQNEIWHSGSEPTTSDEIVIPEENISNYETIIETEEDVVEEVVQSQPVNHRQQKSYEPEPVQTSQKEKNISDYIDKYPSKCGEIFLTKMKQYRFKCHFCKSIIDGITPFITHIAENHYPYNTDIIDNKTGDVDAEKCGNIFMSNALNFLQVCTVCNKPFEEFQLFSKHIHDYHLNILLGNPKTFLDAFQLFAKKMEEKTEFVNDNAQKKSPSVIRGNKSITNARESITPIRQPKQTMQKCDLCNYQCRTLKQLAKHNELHLLPNSAVNQQHHMMQQHQSRSHLINQHHQQQQQQLYLQNYRYASDVEEARIAAEYILS